jgi:hypothetical protein
MESIMEITFKNMTVTEWFFVRDQVWALPDDKLKVSGFCEAYTTRATMPNGDIYVIDDWDGEITSVEKIIKEEDEE